MTSELSTGTALGGCRIESVARRAGVGVVYRATRVADGRTVAIEVIATELAGAAGYRARFDRATRLAASITHPNVLPVLEAGEADGRLYVLTEWVDATDLGTRLSEGGALSDVEAIQTLRPVANALAAAHRRGLIHGDVRPANVLIGAADVYLTGFGLGGERPVYPAPEGGPPTASADIYALGCMLYETLTGRTTAEEMPTGQAVTHEPPAGSVPTPQAELDGPLREIVELARAHDPADRFGSAEELALALEAARASARAAPLAATPLDRAKARSLRVEAPAAAPASASAADAVDAPRRSRHTTAIFAAVAIALAALLVTVLATANGYNTTTSTSAQTQVETVTRTMTMTVATTTPVAAVAPATVTLGQMSVRRVIPLGGPPGGLTVAPNGVAWASVPSRNELVKVVPGAAPAEVGGVSDPGPIAASSAGVWVTDPSADSVSFLTGAGEGGRLALSGRPVAVAAAANPMKGWVAVAGGTVSKLGARGGGVTAFVSRQVVSGITGLAIQAPKWVWATAGGVFRINANDVTSQGANTGPAPTGLAFNDGVWTSRSSGKVTEFDPIPGQFRVEASLQLPAPLTAIAADQRAPFVWALSGPARTLYEITTAHPQVVGTVTFASTPTAVAVTSPGVWVTTANGDLIRIART